MFSIEIYRSAQKQLARIERSAAQRIVDAIRGLASDPRPANVKKLAGRPAWRIRVGDYRVIYEVHDQRLVVLVIEIGHRREVYR